MRLVLSIKMTYKMKKRSKFCAKKRLLLEGFPYRHELRGSENNFSFSTYDGVEPSNLGVQGTSNNHHTTSSCVIDVWRIYIIK